jgi:L-histidine N-alpha-methyltransferase
MHDALAEPDVQVESHLTGDDIDAIVRDVREGLRRPLKELPPKYFYDARGSELFDRITQLPAYYPTRCERALLNRHAPEIVDATAAQELVELGSGTASKTRALLYAMAGSGALRRYVPFDVDATVVERCARELTELYPGLAVHGVVGDFERHLGKLPRGDRRLVAFLGGTLGNLHPAPRAEFLARIRALLGPHSRFLVGVGLVFDRATMEAAYDDPEGVTAEFNRNVLRVLNAALGADFDPEAFDHVAFFDAEASWIEMRLRSLRAQRVSIPGAGIDVNLAPGEEIRTEISAKFTRATLERELEAAGMRLESFMSDSTARFGLALAAPSYS